MAFIGRLDQIGFGRESTAGTSANPTVWFPKKGGGLMPDIQTVDNDAAYGNITKLRDTQAAKETTKVEFKGTIDDQLMGHLFLAALGTVYKTIKIPVSGASGTFVEGETVTESVSSATGVVRSVDITAGSGFLYVSVSSGTFAGGGKTLTGGTSGATATDGTLTLTAAQGFTHLFRLNNSNSHQSYSIWEKNAIGDFKTLYAMMEEITMEVAIGQFATFDAKFLGKKIVTGASQTPSYATENPFLAKFATFKRDPNYSGLGAASAVALERFKITIKKNLEAVQSFGSTDIAAIYNRQFEVNFDFDLRYEDHTIFNIVEASTNDAIRLTLANTDVAIGTTNPTIQIDIPQAGYKTWSKTTDNDGIIRQTIGGVAEFNIARSMPMEISLTNTKLTAYDA